MLNFKARVLSFDCYGTLIDWETGLLAALAPWRRRHALKVGDEALLAAFGEEEAAVETAAPHLRYPDVLRQVLAQLAARHGVSATAAECAAFGNSVGDWPAFSDTVAALQALQRRYRLLVLSNVDRASFIHTQQQLGIEFDAVITAEDTGTYKPAPGHFRAACAWLAGQGYARDDLIHVAQSLYHDHAPALALGLRTVWVDRRCGRSGPGATRAAGAAVRPTWTVPDLATLALWVDRGSPTAS